MSHLNLATHCLKMTYVRKKINSKCTTLFLTNSKIACISSLRADCSAVLLIQTDPPSTALWSGWISSSQIPAPPVLRGQSCGMQMIFLFSAVGGGQDHSPQHKTPWFPCDWHWAFNLEGFKNLCTGSFRSPLIKSSFYIVSI